MSHKEGGRLNRVANTPFSGVDIVPIDLLGEESVDSSPNWHNVIRSSDMKIADKVREASFISRQNRFACLVDLSGGKETVYLPNSGRLNRVLSLGQTVFVVERPSLLRRTRYDLVAASLDGTIVSVDARVPGALIREALLRGALPPFAAYSSIQPEVARGRSRLDFLLSNASSQCFLEVKSVTLAEGGRALFPDSPTLRGRRHLHSLVWAKRDGYAAAMAFVIQHEDVNGFSPNDAIDAEFGHGLRAAQSQGVDIYAYRCRVSPGEIELLGEVPIHL